MDKFTRNCVRNVAAVTAFLIALAAAAETPLAIADDGRPAAEIVVSDGCHSAELFAADDLAHWLEAITGARLPVVTNAPTAAPGAKIRIGAAFGGASGELSTPGGKWPGKDMAVLDFLAGGQK